MMTMGMMSVWRLSIQAWKSESPGQHLTLLNEKKSVFTLAVMAKTICVCMGILQIDVSTEYKTNN